jgi:hypothetical protein
MNKMVSCLIIGVLFIVNCSKNPLDKNENNNNELIGSWLCTDYQQGYNDYRYEANFIFTDNDTLTVNMKNYDSITGQLVSSDTPAYTCNWISYNNQYLVLYDFMIWYVKYKMEICYYYSISNDTLSICDVTGFKRIDVGSGIVGNWHSVRYFEGDSITTDWEFKNDSLYSKTSNDTATYVSHYELNNQSIILSNGTTEMTVTYYLTDNRLFIKYPFDIGFKNYFAKLNQ